MNVRFHLIILISGFLLEKFAHSQQVYSQCILDKPEECDRASLSVKWPKTKMRFLLYTRKTQKDPERLHMCNGTLTKNSRFNPNNRLVVIIPGFMSATCEVQSTVWEEIKDELLMKGDMNVILVITADEYGNEFLSAMENTERAANITIQVLRNIQIATGFKNEDVYLIGHSLGAHVSGLIGQQFPVHRITALDPAGVTYTKDTPIDKRLDPNDADIVDVMHTNGGTGLPYLGAYFPMGDADIYVNGGAIQPSCSNMAWNAVKSFYFMYGIDISSMPTMCSHSKAVEYYKISINNSKRKLVAYACNNYKNFESGNCKGDNVTMGFEFEKSFTQKQRMKNFPRKYYIDTKKSWLFANYFS